MRLATMLAIGLAWCLAAPLGGCARTYRVTLQMAPDSTAAVRVLGSAPRATVENRGPGVVSVTFDDTGAVRSVAPGTATGSTLHGTGFVRLQTADEAASVYVETRGATGLAIDSPE